MRIARRTSRLPSLNPPSRLLPLHHLTTRPSSSSTSSVLHFASPPHKLESTSLYNNIYIDVGGEGEDRRWPRVREDAAKQGSFHFPSPSSLGGEECHYRISNEEMEGGRRKWRKEKGRGRRRPHLNSLLHVHQLPPPPSSLFPHLLFFFISSLFA